MAAEPDEKNGSDKVGREVEIASVPEIPETSGEKTVEQIEARQEAVRKRVVLTLSPKAEAIFRPGRVQEMLLKFLGENPDVRAKILSRFKGRRTKNVFFAELSENIVSQATEDLAELAGEPASLEVVQMILKSLIRERCMAEAARSDAIHDGLTGMLTRKAFCKQFEQEYAQLLREGNHLSFLFVDIDRFKSINDEYGHAVGDEALRRLSSLIKEVVRDSDVIGRYGGDEFVVLCPNTELDGVVEFAKRISEHVMNNPIEIEVEEGQKVSVPFSVTIGASATGKINGAVERKISSAEIEKILEGVKDEADKRMYVAKRAGAEEEGKKGGCIAYGTTVLIPENGGWRKEEMRKTA
ncbi:MAG: GGDEF domain-containing protein [Candidatus Peregrinibacteria bacterium]